MSSATRPVGGYVQDASSFAPIPGVAIAIYHGTQTWATSATDSNGFWLVMGMPTGWAYSLAFSKSGYEGVTAQTGTIPPGTGRYEVDTIYMSKTTGVIEAPKAKFQFDEVVFPSGFSGPNVTVVISFKVRNVGTGEGTPMVWVLFEGAHVAPPSKVRSAPLKANEIWSDQYAFSTGLAPPAEAIMEIYVGFNEENIHDSRISSMIYIGDPLHPAHYFEITRVVAPTAELDAGSVVKITAYVKNVISGAGTVKGEAALQTTTQVFQRKAFEAYGGQEKAVPFDDMIFSSTTQLHVIVRRDSGVEADFPFTIYIKSAPVKVTVGGAVDSPAGAIIDAAIKVNGVSAKYTYSNQYTCTVDKKPQYTITAIKTGYKPYSATINDTGPNSYTHDIDMWPVAVTPTCPAGQHWDEPQGKCVSDTEQPPEGKGSIQGIAVNSADNSAVPDALVRLNAGQAVYTNDAGNFSFANLDPGDYTVYGSVAMGSISLEGTRIINPLQSLSVQPVQVKVEADRVTKVTLIYSPTEINPVWVAAGIAGTASIIAAVVATRKPKRRPPRKRRAPRKPAVHMNSGKVNRHG